MVLHDVPTAKLQVVGILNRRRNADKLCVRYLLHYFASLIRLYLHAKHFCTCIGILRVFLSRQRILDYSSNGCKSL